MIFMTTMMTRQFIAEYFKVFKNTFEVRGKDLHFSCTSKILLQVCRIGYFITRVRMVLKFFLRTEQENICNLFSSNYKLII